jgi:phosphatidylglycerophosphate synthase
MAACTEPEEARLGASLLRRGSKPRVRPELTVELVFRPLAGLVVLALQPLRVAPPAVVLANAAAGLGAAVLVAGDELLAGALLLQLKTVLDNADGQLARATGRTSSLGRYLDTEADLVVNAALFAALARTTGEPMLALVAFVAATLVLSASFNADVLYRRARGDTVVTAPSAEAEGSLARLLERLYRIVFLPQDRMFHALSAHRLGRIVAGTTDPELRAASALAYFDGFTSAVLSNLGLSTQLAALGVCLALGVPELYLWLALSCAACLPLLQARRELAARRVLRRGGRAG